MTSKLDNYFKEDEYTSSEFLFTCFSMLESRGYVGFNEFLSVVDDYEVIIKFLRLFSGMTLKIPSLSEFRLCLLASAIAYVDLVKRNDKEFGKKYNYSIDSVKETLQLTPEDSIKVDEIYNQWLQYMDKTGYPIDVLFNVSRKDTKDRFRSFKSKGNKKKKRK